MDDLLGYRDQGSRAARRSFIALVYATISVLLVLGGIAGIRNPDLLWGQAWKIALLHPLAGATASPFFVGLKRVQLCAEDDALSSGSARDIEQLHSFRRYLRTATASMGTTVALAVVSTGALRTAVEAASGIPLPEEFVVLYGAFLTRCGRRNLRLLHLDRVAGPIAFAPRLGFSVLDCAGPGLSDVVEDEEPRDPGRPARHFGVEHQRPESTATCAVRRPVPEFGDASAI